MDDEPLERWARRREAKLRPEGTLRVTVLGGDARSAAHIDPDKPRLIERWDGYQWVAWAIADDYKAACRLLNPVPEPKPEPADLPRPEPLRSPGKGRHRKPPAAGR